MRAGAANLDKMVYLLLFLSLFLYVHSTRVAFVWTPTHHYLLGLPVNLWVMSLGSSKSKDDVLFPEVSDCEGRAFRMSIILENCVNDFRDQTCLIASSIDFEDWDGTLQLLSVKSVTFHIVPVHELAGGSAVDECRSGFDFHSVCGLDLYFNG